MSNQPPTPLVEHSGFSALLHSNASGIPNAITIHKAASDAPVLTFEMDAVDAMGFCNAAPLLQLPFADRPGAIECLATALKEKFGGKNMMAIPPELVPLFESNGFHISPKTSGGGTYSRLMAASVGTVAYYSAALASNRPFNPRFRIVTNKEFLGTLSNELSELFIQNADYANAPDKKALYTPDAMKGRISHPNVRTMAVLDENDKPVGFIRAYAKEGVGIYVSDLVVAKEHRHSGLGIGLMHKAIENLKYGLQENMPLFIIAGNEKEMGFYDRFLGFESVSEQKAAPKGQQFMFGLFPQKEILVNLKAQLELSAPAIPTVQARSR